MAKTAALYLRSSKDRHDVSIDAQQRELRAFATQLGSSIVEEFIDKVESAKTDNRPAFQEMISEVKSNSCRFEQIICYDTSRFARRQYHAQMYKHLLKKQGKELLFLKLPKTDPLLDPIVESLMEIFDEFHSQKSKMDGLRGMRENIKQGYRAGGQAPAGYKLEKHVVGTRDGIPITKSTLAADPVKFPVVQEYLERRCRGESRKFVMSSMHLPLSLSQLIYIEDNALTYAGHTVWNKHQEKIDGSRIKGRRYRDRSEWVIHPNTHPAMISEDAANRLIEEQINIRSTRKIRRLNDYLLSGLVQCTCGAPYDGDGGYYRCRARCGNKGINKSTLEASIIDVLFSELFTLDFLTSLRDEAVKQQRKKPTAAAGKKAGLKKEIRDLDKESAELVSLLTQIKHQRPLLQRLETIEQESEALKSQLEKFDSANKPALASMSKHNIKKFLVDFQNDLESENPEMQKAVFKSLIQKIKMEGKTAEIFPSYKSITGGELASPRGFEPLLPP